MNFSVNTLMSWITRLFSFDFGFTTERKPLPMLPPTQRNGGSFDETPW